MNASAACDVLPRTAYSPAAEGNASVLLVEDDPMLARAISRVLQGGGVKVTHVSDGDLAEQMIKARQFDVVLSDLHMSRVGGLEVAAYAREHAVGTSVILMTADPSVDTAARAVELGALRYLVKPTPPEMLLASVRGAARVTRQRRATPLALVPREDLSETSLEQRFSSALDQLWMAYQPIHSADGTVFAYEALVRSDEPTLRNPAVLLDTAEKLHAVHLLGRRIRHKVAEMLARSPEHVRVFVNLHPLDLLDEELTGKQNPLAPYAERVTLEMTERAALDDMPDADDRIEDLRDLGFALAIDDLGAGYAGLTSLAKMSPEVVKLDMSLIRNIDRDSVRQKLVGMVVSVSHELGARVVAEGIETAAEREVVERLGCDLLQGYLLGKPARVDVLK